MQAAPVNVKIIEIDCSAVFSALFKIQTRTHLLVIYVHCFMYFGFYTRNRCQIWTI